MIKGKKRERLTKEVILQKIGEYDIYKAFSPKFVLGRRFSSPMPGREDDNPSFIINHKYGNYFHCDYGESKYYGNAFDFVMQLKGCDFLTALKLIDTELGLGISAPLKDWKATISSYKQPEIKDEQETHIECTHQRFTVEAHKYWNAYHLSEDYLKNRLVYQVKTLYINRQKFHLPWGEIVFVYLTPEGKMKIYRPTVSRKSKDPNVWRFRSNVPFTYISNWEHLKDCKKVLVTKSKKDELVTSLLTDCVGSTQAESIACFSEETIEGLKDKTVYLNYGSDDQGKRESKLITSSFGWKHYNTEDKYLPHNDIAEVVKYHGLEIIEKHMKLKKII